MILRAVAKRFQVRDKLLQVITHATRKSKVAFATRMPRSMNLYAASQ